LSTHKQPNPRERTPFGAASRSRRAATTSAEPGGRPSTAIQSAPREGEVLRELTTGVVAGGTTTFDAASRSRRAAAISAEPGGRPSTAIRSAPREGEVLRELTTGVVRPAEIDNPDCQLTKHPTPGGDTPSAESASARPVQYTQSDERPASEPVATAFDRHLDRGEQARRRASPGQQGGVRHNVGRDDRLT
jgi:hypothetical protein